MNDLAAYAGLFVAALVAATFIPFLPASSELALAGLLAAGKGHPGILFVVATLGNVGGSILNFYVGRSVSRLRERRWFPIAERRLQTASAWFERYGAWLLLMSWMPIVGDPITVVAGMLRTPFLRFLILVIIAKAGRYLVLIAGLTWFQT
ncbi:YqaA family protein [Terrihabitans sp. B22-R8]|uniref:YqaA family protein n=1 Tax=Terrihabitans sp. B22-R8 TaxID=3425128 RepID=UPI00403CB27B